MLTRKEFLETEIVTVFAPLVNLASSHLLKDALAVRELNHE